jgi:hypothetical protein
VHGFVLTEIQRFVETRFDRKTWYALLERAGLADREYVNFLEYPDEEAVGLVATASEMTGRPSEEILDDFGFFLGADLLRIYKPLLNPTWGTIDFLANVEQTIHRVVRDRNRQAKPPGLVCRRLGPAEVMIVYRSPRRLCALARGIVRGVASHYGEEIDLVEESCMHRGDASCNLRVSLR